MVAASLHLAVAQFNSGNSRMMMKPSIPALLFVVLLFLVPPILARAGKIQVVLTYDDAGIEVVDVTPISGMEKTITQPGLTGANAIIVFEADWLDEGGNVVAASTMEIPVTRRAPMLAEAEGVCKIVAGSSGIAMVRIDGPEDLKALRQLRLYNGRGFGQAVDKGSWPGSLQGDEVLLNLPKQQFSDLKVGPVGHEKVHDSGPDENRFVFVVLGDGYTQENLDAGLFDSHVDAFMDALWGKDPWGDYMGILNVYKIDVVSNEEGADNIDGPDGPLVDTYFNTAFWSEGIERLLMPNVQGWGRAALAANQVVGVGMWDQIVLLVNSTKYGGSGGTLAVGSANEWAAEIILHELGHSVAGLADEYSTPFPGFPPGDHEPNVSFTPAGAGLKWLPWVEEGTPLPTPDTTEFDNVVGSFEGARYLESGIYRPWRSCLMRTLGRDHCPVCREAHLSRLFRIVEPADEVRPSTVDPVSMDGPRTFEILPVQTGAWSHQWWLDGRLLTQVEGTITLNPGDIQGGAGELRGTITHESPWMRLETVSANYEWTLEGGVTPEDEVWMIY